MRGKDKILIIGAGPAGLTAGLELVKHDFDVSILEASNKVGGISRTEEYRGYKFDIGGHRFYTKNKEVKIYWKNILGEELLHRKRKSRILYEKKYYDYPISFFNALKNLGIKRSIKALASYGYYRIKPVKPEVSYADWMKNRFGNELFETFFKTYTEKVWGIDVNEISKDWALQRVKTLSLGNAVLDALIKNKRKKITTLTDEFHYPKFGPGQMWEKVSNEFIKHGGKIIFGQKIERIYKRDNVFTIGNIQDDFDHIISTMPLRSLIHSLSNVPEKIISAANTLKYRDFVTVLLIINKKFLFDDNWIYIHEPNVRVGRIQNFKNWSPYMVPDENKTSLGFEYFFSEGDEFWQLSDEEIFEQAKREFSKLGFGKRELIEDGCVVRVKKAYPVYDNDYKKQVKKIRNYLEENYRNIHLIGRNGMHKYNNQDHSMATAFIIAENIIAKEKIKNPWRVNNDAEYIEEITTADSGGRSLPKKISGK